MPSDNEFDLNVEHHSEVPPRYAAPFTSAFIQTPHESSVLKENHIPLIQSNYSIPPRFKIRLPKDDESPSTFSSTELCFFTDHFKYGLRLPLCDEFIALMLHTGFVPAMLTPNAIAQIFCSIEYFDSKGITWTPLDFLFVFETRKHSSYCYFQSKKGQFGLEGYPSSNPKWKSRFVFIEDTEGWIIPTNPTHVDYQIFDPPAPSASAMIKNLLVEVGETVIDVRDYLPPFMNLTGKVAAGPPRRTTALLEITTEGTSSEMSPKLRTMGRNPLSSENSPPQKKRKTSDKSRPKVRDSVVGPSSDYLVNPSEEGTPSFSSTDPTSSDLNPMIIEETSPHITWNAEKTIATVHTALAPEVRKNDERPSAWAMHYGQLLSSQGDQERMKSWPKKEIPCRLMDDALRSYRSQYFVCQEFYSIKEQLRYATNNWEKYEKEAKQLSLEAISYASTVKNYEEKAGNAEKDKMAAEEEIIKLKAELLAATTNISELNSAYLSCSRAKNTAELKLTLADTTISELEADLAKARATFSEVISSSNLDLRAQQSLIANKDDLIDQLIKQHADDQASVSNLEKELSDLKKTVEDPEELRTMYAQTDLYKEEMLHFGQAGFKFVQACIKSEVPDSDSSKAHILEVLKGLDYSNLIQKIPEEDDDEEQ